jgi:hypothetical protein
MTAFFALCSFSITSCSDDEGGEIEISLNTEDFIIAGVVDKTNDNNQYINGEIYAVDEGLTRYDEKQ